MKALYTFFKPGIKNLARIVIGTIFIAAFSINAMAQVSSNGTTTNISADNAANASSPLYSVLSNSGNNIVISENSKPDFSMGTDVIVLSAPTGWQFKTSGVTASYKAGQDMTGTPVVSMGASAITVTVTVGGTSNKDVLTIMGVNVEATDGANVPGTGNITATATSGTVNGLASVNLGTLTQTVGAVTYLLVSLPGQTYTDGTTVATSGNSGTITSEVAGTSFSLAAITAVDQFLNKVTGYTGTKTLVYSGPANGPSGGTPAYTTSVAFTSGVSTTTLTTTLKKAQSTTISVTSATAPAVSIGLSSSSLTVNPGALNNFLVEANGGGGIATQTAGTAFSIQITARDANNNVLSAGPNAFNSSVNLSAAIGAISPTSSSSALTNGILTGQSVTVYGASSGAQTITATSGAVNTASAAFSVTALAFSQLQVLLPGETAAPGSATGKTGSPSGQIAGTSFSVIVNAVDPYWNLISSGTGSADMAAITSTDPNFTPPTNPTLVSGTKTFSVTLVTDGSWTVTGTDVSGGSGSPNTSSSVTVVSGAFTKFQVLLPGETPAPGTATGFTGSPSGETAGSAFSVIVNAVDAHWNVVTTGTGSAHVAAISSTDPNDVPPGQTALSSGTYTFSLTLVTAGSWTVTGTDMSGSPGSPNTSPSVTVSAGAVSQLQVLLPGETAAPGTGTGKSGSPSAEAEGSSFTVTINGVDAHWNLVSSATNAITISSSDANAVLPSGASLAMGTQTFSVTCKTAGTQSVTATTSGLTTNINQSASFTVSVGAFVGFQILMPSENAAPGTATGKTGSPSNRTSGTAFNIIVNAVDNNWNVVTSGTGSTHTALVSSTDANFTSVSSALGSGTKTFSVTPITAGSWTFTATDQTAPTGSPSTSPSVTVIADAISKLQVLLPGEIPAPGTATGKIGTPSAQTAGTPFSFTVSGVDAHWNLVSSATNSVSVTCSDANAVLPSSASLSSGTQAFSVTCKTAASQTVTATTTGLTTNVNPSASFTVNPAAFSKLQILLPGETAAPGSATGKTGAPTAINSGTSLTATVNGVDAYWNKVTSAVDNINIASPDIYPATIAANAILVSGTKGFSVTLFTGPTETITASDVINGLITSNTSAAVTVKPVARIASASHNWNNTATWAGGIIPASTDSVFIDAGVTVTVTANTTVAVITFDSSSASTSTLTVNTGTALNVNGGITLLSNKPNTTTALIAGLGTINADSVIVGGNLNDVGNTSFITTLTSTISTLNISGNLSIYSFAKNPSHNDVATFALQSGVTTVDGTVNMQTQGSNSGTAINAVLTMATGAQTGTLVLKGSTPFTTAGNNPNNATVTLNGTGATVNYAGGTQDVFPTVYTNLDLSGSGNKNISNGTAANAAVNILGTAKANIASGVTLITNSLSLNGTGEAIGTWGGVHPPATNVNTTYFTTTAGSGDINVTTVVRSTPVFSGLSANQEICYNSSFSVVGTVSFGSTVHPAIGETIYATVNGTTQSGLFTNSTGGFTLNFPGTTNLAQGSSFTIDYFYGGNTSLNAIENTSTSVTIDSTSVGGTATVNTSPICSGTTSTISLSGKTGAVQWQQSANGLTGWGSVSGGSGATSTLYTTAAITSSTVYRAVVTYGTCPADTSSKSTVSVTAPYTVVTSGPDFTCQSATPTPITLSGASVGNGATTGAWSITSGTGSLGSTAQTSTPASVTFTPASNVNQTVVLTLLTNAPGICPANSATRTVNIFPAGEWKGTSSINWNDVGNWCNGVPTAGTSVTIPAGTPFPPTINSTAACLNLTINSGATLTMSTSGDLSLYGSITNNGTYTQTAGILELTGSSNQSIPAISVVNLVVNNTSGGVTLSGNINVSGTLTLTSGVVNTGADSVIVSNTAAAAIVAGGSNTYFNLSWVNGNLKRYFSNGASGTWIFPLGTSSVGYEAAIQSSALTFTTGQPSYFFSAAFNGPLTQSGYNVNSNLKAWETGISGSPETPYTSINSTGSWKIEPNIPARVSGNYSVSLYFFGFSGMASNEFGILKRSDTSTTYAAFKPAGGTINATNGLGRVTTGAVGEYALRMGLTSFSEFAIGQSGTVLPIQLVSFTAEKCDNNQDALLKWNTASELNNDHFDVQAANTTNPNGDLVFTKIGEVQGNGTSDIAHNYSFTDVTPGKYGNRYYRLGQVDFNGDVNYSDIVALNFDASPILTTKLYPNPTNDMVNYLITSSGNAGVTVSVTNITGQEIFMEQTTISAGSNTLSMDVSQLIPGIYFFNINDGKGLSIHTRFEKF